MTDLATCRLYLVTPPALPDPAAFARGPLAQALAGGDVAALQVRLKRVEDDVVRRAVEAVRAPALAAGVALILNDRPDLARELGCDGVHIGQEDAPLTEARRIMGRSAMIGVTCHDSRHLAFEAADGGADYVAFGAFFPTSTKEAATRADPELLTGWQQGFETPCVAIGGVTVGTARELARAGADFLAVSAGVWAFDGGPEAAVRRFVAEMAAGAAERS